MGSYLLKRFGQSIITVVIVCASVFMMLRLMPTSGYFTREDYVNMNEVQRAVYLKDLGVAGNPIGQMARFAKNVLHGDFGRSITLFPRTPIGTIIAEKARYSLYFGLTAIAISMVLGLSLGVLMARFKDGPIDWAGTGYVTIIRALPPLIWLFFIQYGATGLLSLPFLFHDDQPVSWILPTISLSLMGIGWYAIWLRRFMVDEENRDYVKFATAKGLPRRRVMTSHVLRIALVPLVQYFPQQILLTVAGSLIVESIYSIPGMGGLLVSAIRQQDNPLVQTIVLLYAILGVIGVFLGDILMVLVDPRIKLDAKGGH
jgi:oligopeptide transport system permease protein